MSDPDALAQSLQEQMDAARERSPRGVLARAYQALAQRVTVEEPPRERAKREVEPKPAPRLSRDGLVSRRLRMRRDVLDMWRQLEETFARYFPEESFVLFACRAVFESWVHALGESDVFEYVYRAAGYECESPACTSSELTCHHMKRRSQGGTHAPANCAGMCFTCHLVGEHGGNLKVFGPKSRLGWLIGEDPILLIVGREKRELV